MLVRKKNIKYDSLYISFNEIANFDIYQDDNKYTSIVLHKNNGITLPKSSVINFKCSKNLFLIEIQNKNTENTLTK